MGQELESPMYLFSAGIDVSVKRTEVSGSLTGSLDCDQLDQCTCNLEEQLSSCKWGTVMGNLN